MVRVLNDGGGPADAANLVDLQQKGEGGTNDPADCLHYLVQRASFIGLTAPKPRSDAVRQYTFIGALVEGVVTCIY